MPVWPILLVLLVLPLLGFLVYLALSSCLGDSLRGPRIPRPSFGRTYYLGSVSTGAWESVEMHGIRRESESESDLSDLSEDDLSEEDGGADEERGRSGARAGRRGEGAVRLV